MLVLSILLDDESESRFNEKGGYDSSDIVDKLQQIPDLKVIVLWVANPKREVIQVNQVEDWPIELEEK